jgi:hypothetical protein
VVVDVSEAEGKPLGRGLSTVSDVEIVPKLPFQKSRFMGLSPVVQRLRQ